jgi:BON domain
MPATLCLASEKKADQPDDSAITRRAQNLIAGHPHFRTHSAGFDFELSDNVLVVRGRVPTFYLKQLLQNALMQLAQVRRVDNRVEVVSCEGLSSIC